MEYLWQSSPRLSADTFLNLVFAHMLVWQENYTAHEEQRCQFLDASFRRWAEEPTRADNLERAVWAASPTPFSKPETQDLAWKMIHRANEMRGLQDVNQRNYWSQREEVLVRALAFYRFGKFQDFNIHYQTILNHHGDSDPENPVLAAANFLKVLDLLREGK